MAGANRPTLLINTNKKYVFSQSCEGPRELNLKVLFTPVNQRGWHVIRVYVTRVSSRIGAAQRWHLVWRVSRHFFAVEIATITRFSFSFFCHVDSMIGTTSNQSSGCTFLISVFARMTYPNAIHTESIFFLGISKRTRFYWFKIKSLLCTVELLISHHVRAFDLVAYTYSVTLITLPRVTRIRLNVRSIWPLYQTPMIVALHLP